MGKKKNKKNKYFREVKIIKTLITFYLFLIKKNCFVKQIYYNYNPFTKLVEQSNLSNLKTIRKTVHYTFNITSLKYNFFINIIENCTKKNVITKTFGRYKAKKTDTLSKTFYLSEIFSTII